MADAQETYIMCLFKTRIKGNQKGQISITFAYIDEEDKGRFVGKCQESKGYIVLKQNRQQVSRILMNCKKGDQRIIDHVDQRKNNNCKSNLDDSNGQKNAQNKPKKANNVTTKYIGIGLHRGKWRVRYLSEQYGRFDSETEAARTYDSIALYHNRKDTNINFTDSQPLKELPEINRMYKDENMHYIRKSKKDGYRLFLPIDGKAKYIKSSKNIDKLKQLRDQLIEQHQIKDKQAINNEVVYQNGIPSLPYKAYKKNETKYTLISKEDIEDLRTKRLAEDNQGYVNIKKQVLNGQTIQKKITLQVYIMQKMGINSDNQLTDHQEGNRADNRREKLRPASYSQNGHNRQMLQDKKTNYIGVTLNKSKSKKKYESIIRKDGERYFLGLFEDQKTAAIARDIKAIELYGDYAKLNDNLSLDNYRLVDDCLFYKNQQLSFKQKYNKFIGVGFIKNRNSYSSIIINQGKQIYVGNYKQEIQAAIARELKIKQLDLEGKTTMNNVDTTGYSLDDKNKLYYQGKLVQE